jgi:hypothetical protein
MDANLAEERARIARQVKRELGNRVLDLEILVEEEGLVLRGRTNTYYAKQLVQHAVMRLTRCRVAANQVAVS